MIIAIIFFIECLLKIIARGFVKGKSTYLKSGWNKLDFLVVVTGMYGMLLSSSG